MNKKWLKAIAFFGPSIAIGAISLLGGFSELSLIIRVVIYIAIISISWLLYYLATKSVEGNT